jgi:hypothetical protein
MLWGGHSRFLPPTLHRKAPQGQHQDHDLCCSTVGLFGVAGRGEQLVVRIATRAAARVLGPPSPFANAPPAYAPRLPSQQPRAWSRRSRKDVKMGHYEPATTERGRGVRQRVVRRELDATSGLDSWELRTVWNLWVCTASLLSPPTQ